MAFPKFTAVRIVKIGIHYRLINTSSNQYADELFNTHHDAHFYAITMRWKIEW